MYLPLRPDESVGDDRRAKSSASPIRTAGAGAAVLPPYFKLRTKQSGCNGAVSRFEKPAAVGEEVTKLARDAGVPAQLIYLAAFQTLLFRYTNHDEICIGAAGPAVAPDAEIHATDHPCGIAAIAGKFAGENTFRQIIDRAGRRGKLSHARASDQCCCGQAIGAEAPFRSAFIYRTAVPGRLADALSSHDQQSELLPPKYDLALVVTEPAASVDPVVIGIEYNTELYTVADAQRIIGHYLTLLEHACRAPQTLIADLSLLTADEYRQIVFDWNRTAGPYPSETLIQQGFEDRAREAPDRIAVIAGGREFTYGQIEQRANRLAHCLIEHGVGPGTFTGICLKRSEEMIIAVLAVLKAGGAYVPLDTAYPKDRLAFMLKDTAAGVVITQSSLLDRLPAAAAAAKSARYLCLEEVAAKLAGQRDTAPERRATPDDRCYVIFTSGSTGRPKGVVLRHRAVTNVLDWVNLTFAVNAADRLLFVTSLSFDLSVYDIFGVLGAGGSIRVASEMELGDPTTLLGILKSERITIWDSAPAALSRLAPFFAATASDANANDSALRLVMLSGDWIPVPLPDQVRGQFPGARVISLGGATEAAVWSNWYGIEKVDPAWPSIPYGKPIRNARYHILDAHLKPVPVGVPGELHIGGGVLAEGYLHREELNRARFIDDPIVPFVQPGAHPQLSSGNGAGLNGHAGRSTNGGTQDGDGKACVNKFPNWPTGSKVYKTGDLARYLPDGNIEFLGRMDTQVKIRGFRVEAGEIESLLLLQHASVQDAVVKAHKDSNGQNFLVAYVVARAGHSLTPVEIQRHLHKQLPDYMVPQQVVLLAALPLTQNGKVDRNILAPPAVGTVRAPGRECVPPATDAERALVAIWEEALGVTPIGVNDDFNELGGHSLTAAMVMALVESRLGHRVPIEVLLSKPTVRGLAEVITSKLELGGSVLIPLQTSGTHPPLFLIAGAGGHVFAFHAFARRLGSQFNVYGMRAVGIDGTEPPLDSIPAIAARYLKEIQAAQPEGPYVLSGYSIGGIIAFELAQQMQAAGMKVSRVIVFDLMAPGYPRRLPFWQRAYLHGRRILAIDWREKWGYLIERAKNVAARVMSRFGRYRVPAGQIPGIDVIPHQRVRAVLNGLLKGWSHYWPQKAFDGQIVMMSSTVADDWVGSVMDDPSKGWSRWSTQPVKLCSINAPHTLFFREGYVDQLVGRVREVLETAKDQSQASGEHITAGNRSGIREGEALQRLSLTPCEPALK
jgi:amino acid adenylation domain-containing protein